MDKDFGSGDGEGRFVEIEIAEEASVGREVGLAA
jgi:hypothetical protein